MKAILFIQSEHISNAVKGALREAGIGVMEGDGASAASRASFVMLDRFFLELGTANLIRKESLFVPIVLLARKGEAESPAFLSQADLYETILVETLDDRSAARAVKGWLSAGGGRFLKNKREANQ